MFQNAEWGGLVSILLHLGRNAENSKKEEAAEQAQDHGGDQQGLCVEELAHFIFTLF